MGVTVSDTEMTCKLVCSKCSGRPICRQIATYRLEQAQLWATLQDFRIGGFAHNDYSYRFMAGFWVPDTESVGIFKRFNGVTMCYLKPPLQFRL